MTGVSTDTFKDHLDRWLQKVPDQPKSGGYSKKVPADTNGVIHQVMFSTGRWPYLCGSPAVVWRWTSIDENSESTIGNNRKYPRWHQWTDQILIWHPVLKQKSMVDIWNYLKILKFLKKSQIPQKIQNFSKSPKFFKISIFFKKIKKL